MLGLLRPGDQPKRIIIKHSTMIYAIGISAVSNDCLQFNGKLLPASVVTFNQVMW